ncbi:hypothetical protein F5051DRAFT_479169 [Lentinula edodes]|nr:hypothetical protein F5051DRAFT_479169 [Lentinula edodes]
MQAVGKREQMTRERTSLDWKDAHGNSAARRMRARNENVWVMEPTSCCTLKPPGGKMLKVQPSEKDIGITINVLRTKVRINRALKRTTGRRRNITIIVVSWIIRSHFPGSSGAPYPIPIAVTFPFGVCWRWELNIVQPCREINSIIERQLERVSVADNEEEFRSADAALVSGSSRREDENALREGSDTEDARYGFEEYEQEPYYMSSLGLAIERCVLPASKTMVQADILFNLLPTEQYSKFKSSAHVPFVGNLGPFSWYHRNFASAKGEDKQAMQRHMKTAASWDFERMIPCHEDVIEVGDKNAWKTAYKAYLN